jgi:hypothetical protein
MRVLMVNKFLYPKGGAETYVLKLGKILQDQGMKCSISEWSIRKM